MFCLRIIIPIFFIISSTEVLASCFSFLPYAFNGQYVHLPKDLEFCYKKLDGEVFIKTNKDGGRLINYKKTSVEKINELIIKASKSKNLKNILTTNKLPLVSIDFNHNPSSSVFDLTQTQVLNGNFCRVLSWYDNEWGFSNRMIDTMLDFKKLL